MIKQRMYELKDLLENAGWRIENNDEIFSVADDKIEWSIFREKTSSKETYTFYLFDDLGRRTTRLSDIFYVARSKDSMRLDIQQNSSTWRSELKKFVYETK